ncbi:hypothetical protein JHK86_050467 [Glycine max]|nr:hypothetical protein JHK86_050467 [Glycine max]
MADRISSLPDTLLCHILSFLPTIESVATSVLSKRWRPLWRSVPSLHFNDQIYWQYGETYYRFVQLVYTVMLRRDVTRPIERFNLECVSCLCDPSVIDTWLIATIHGKVKHLSLLLPSDLNLPCCILTSTTLVDLKLKGLTLNSRVSSVDLPSLKKLHLRKVHFVEPRLLLQILSACPLLEDLLIRSLHVTNNFSSDEHLERMPKLVKADISNASIDVQMATFYNVEFLRTQVGSDFFSDNKHTFLNLTHMELIFRFRFNVLGRLINLLHECPNLQILVVDEGNLFVKTSSDVSYPQFVPKCLSTQLKRCCVKKYGGQESELRFARYVLQNARVLYSMTIYSISSSNSGALVNGINPSYLVYHVGYTKLYLRAGKDSKRGLTRLMQLWSKRKKKKPLL